MRRRVVSGLSEKGIVMKSLLSVSVLAALALVSPALGQASGDLRVRAEIRAPDDGQWAAGESLGNVEFRVRARYSAIYYGGVVRSDDYRFSVQLSFTDISDFSSQFAGSRYNTDYDVYINNAFVGRADTNAETFGISELEYDSRHAEAPALPLPAAFPEPVNVGDTVRIFVASAGAAPEIGASLPSGQPLFQSVFAERFSRGDVNQDGKVNMEDFAYLAANYDPYHRTGQHIGPGRGDFSGDNLADQADYALFVQNWDANGNPPAEPVAIAPQCRADFNNDGPVTTQDLFAFLNAWFAGSPQADIDQSGSVASADIFEFVNAWFAGCV